MLVSSMNIMLDSIYHMTLWARNRQGFVTLYLASFHKVLNLRLQPFFVHTSRKGSYECAFVQTHLRGLILDFVVRKKRLVPNILHVREVIHHF